MILHNYATHLWLAIALLLGDVTGEKTCGIIRDTRLCKEIPGKNFWRQEYNCLMEQNDLKTVMDCVKKNNGANINDEVQICRSQENGLFDDEEDYFESEYSDDNFYNVAGEICLKPRTILIYGPPLVAKAAALLGVSGAVGACPYGNLNFHKCLCGSSVGKNSIIKLAAYFKGEYTSDLACSRGVSKRTDFLDNTIHKPHMHQARDNTWGGYIHKSYWLTNFTIDDYGRPIYFYGSVGDRLPYFDQYVRDPAFDDLGTLARRCYIHPDVNEVAECRTWVLTSTSVPASSYSIYPEMASYRKNFTRTATYTSLQTVEPSQTDVPTAMPVVVNNTNTTPTSTTPTQTGAAQTGSTGAATTIFGSVSITRIVCFAVFVFIATSHSL